MNYGIPYMGSKNFIASWIADTLPGADILVDLFAGGCAVTHAAILSGKWNNFIANDITDAPRLFNDAIAGKYKNENHFVTREEFFARKDTDPYVRYCWSFGNSGDAYMYGRNIEKLRHLQWDMCFASTPYEVKVRMRAVFQEVYNLGLLLCKPDYWKGFKDNPKMLATVKQLASDINCSELTPLDSLKPLESLQRLQSLESLENTPALSNLAILQKDYREVTIPANSVIYCDIPYKNCAGYNGDVDTKGNTTFNHAAFYDWCEVQSSPVFISEYDMPRDRFFVVDKKEKLVRLNSGSHNRKTEHIFAPIKQKELIGRMRGEL